MKTKLLLLRHGMPQAENCLLGRTDSALTKRGWRQLEATCETLKNISLVVTSPLERCKAFANRYAEANQLPLEVIENFQECDFGDIDGLTFEELAKKYPELLTGFLTDPVRCIPPNGESLDSFTSRVLSAANALIDTHAGKTILLVTHGGVIKTLLGWCLDIERLSKLPFQRLNVDYASISQIDFYHENTIFPQLIKTNYRPSEINP